MRRFFHFIAIPLFLVQLTYQAAAQGSQTVNNGAATTAVGFPGTGCYYSWVNDTPGIGLAASGAGGIPSFTAVNTGNSAVKATITATLVPPAAYIGNEGDSTVSVVATADQTVIATIKMAGSPDHIVVSPDASRVYVTMGTYLNAPGVVAVINTATNQVIATIPATSSNPGNMVISPDGSKLYVTDDFNYLTVISTATNTVTSTHTLNSPGPLAVSPDGATLYVADIQANSVDVINSSTYQVTANIPVGSDPVSAAITPDGRQLYIGNYSSGNVSVINTATNTVTATIPVGSFAIYMSMSADGSVLYVGGVNGNSSTISVISTATNTASTVYLIQTPYGICVTPDGTQLYINNSSNSDVTVLDTKTDTVSAILTTGFEPFSPGNFITGGSGCSGTPLKFTITVKPAASAPPTITAVAATGSISACAGTASSSPNIQQFTVSGSNLTGNITATAPTGFEISLSPGNGYGSGVTLTQTGGTIGSTVIYVCSAASATPGNISGHVTLTSPGTTSQAVVVTGTVNALPIVNAVPPQTVGSGTATTAVNFTGTGNSYTWVNNTPGIGLAANGAGNIAPFTALNAGNSPLTATLMVTPELSGFAYIANSGSNTVSVINTTTNEIATTITVASQPYGVSVSPDGSKVYVTNELSSSVSVINTSTNTVTATIPVGQFPISVTESPDGNTVYVVNDQSSTISVINAGANIVEAVIPICVQSTGIAVSPDGSKLYLSCAASGTVTVINTATNTVITTIPVGNSPGGVSLSPDGSKIYVANTNDNTVSVINSLTNTVQALIGVGSQPFGVSVSPDGSRIYVANSASNTVSVINTTTNTVVSTITVGSQPYDISVSPDGSKVYATNNGSNAVSIISTGSNTVIATVTGLKSPGSFGNFITAGAGCSGPPITFTITVNPTPNITAGIVTGAISACAGTASVSPNIQQFTVSGSNLTGNITAAAPTGFEVSLNPGSGYGATVALPQTGGTVSNTVIYVCSASTDLPGNISGNVTLTGPGATSQAVAVTGTVNAFLTVNTIPPQTVNNGTATTAVNFTGTGNSYGWVNNAPGIGLPASGTGNIPSFTAVNTSGSPVIATITVTPQRPGIAYISNSISNNVTAINTLTNTVAATIPVGSAPLGVAVSPDNTRVYIANSLSNTVSVINTTTNTVVATIPVGQMPQAVSVSADGSRVYVCNLDNSVSVIATTSNTVTATIEGFIAPFALAASTSGNILFVSNVSGTVSVVNTATNTIQQTITVGGNFSDPYQILVSPDGSHAYVTNFSSNTVSVINTATYSVVNTIPVGMGPGGMAISPDGNFIYVSCYYGGNVSVINTNTDAIVQTININSPVGISVTADGKNVYVVNNPSSVTQGTPATVSVISTATNSVVATVPVGAGPNSLGNFIAAGIQCSTPGTFTITVNPAANNITAGPVTGSISACEGTASASPNIQQFTVSTSGLTGNITATAPTGFELSLSAGSGYSGSVTLTQTGGTVVYVRSAATAPAGDISGDVTLASAGVTTPDVVVTGVINALPSVNAVPNQTVNSGAMTTAIDFSGTGNTYNWANNLPAIGLPASGIGNISPFTAINTGNSPVTATITVIATTAVSDCTSSPLSFTVTVIPGEIGPTIIPNTFTPNGDGINDTWDIKFLNSYPQCTVQIFNRWGQNVYSSIGYGIPWDGTYKGAALPSGTYYYVINLQNNSQLLSGWVAIIR